LEGEDARANTFWLQSEIESLNKILSDAEEARKKLEADKARFRDENTSLRQKLEKVKKELAARFPKINNNPGNLSSIIVKNGEKKGRKRRQYGK